MDENHRMEAEKYLIGIDSLTIHADEGDWISEVQDLCMNDSWIFILDINQTVFKVDVHTGLIAQKMHKRGHSESEVIAPKAITTSGDTLYVLDFQSMAILSFDMNLSFLSRFQIPFPALDFAKVDNGFLLYNINATDELKQIVHIDERGQVIGSYFDKDSDLDMLLSDKIFMEATEGEIYFMLPASDKIYKWRDGKILNEYILDYGNGKVHEKKSSNLYRKRKDNAINAFVMQNYVVISFLSQSMVKYNFYDRRTKESDAGMVACKSSAAFYPRWQYQTCLIGISDIADEHIGQGEMKLLFYRFE